MAHRHEQKQVNPKSIEQGYEVGEMGFKVILIFGLIISGATVLSMIVMVFFFGALERYAPSTSQYSPSPLAAEQPVAPVSQAPVEAEPVVDRLALETEAQQGLHEYAWISETAGIARIPIDEAIKLILDQGTLPRLAPIEAAIGVQNPAAGDSLPAGNEAGAAQFDPQPATAPHAGQE